MQELITFKGNREGLTVILDVEADFQEILARLADKLAEASRFLEESEVSVDVGPRDLQPEELESLTTLIRDNRLHLRRILAGPRPDGDPMSCLQEVGEMAKNQASWRLRKKKKRKGQLAAASDSPPPAAGQAVEAVEMAGQEKGGDHGEDDIPVIRYSAPVRPRADIISDEQTILIQRTVRSGQRIFYPGNVVVLGDVNPGGEIIAGGNIIVMGTFRGIAHAGALGEEKAVVAALRLEPSQLRIASYVTRAPDGDFSLPQQQPEIARVQDGIVIIEQYQPGSDRYLSGLGKGGA